MTALFVHQPRTLPQKIDSRRRFVSVQKGGSCTCRQNEFLFKLTATSTHFWAICSKIQCVLVLNAVCFGAKRKVKWC